jgi:DNA-binding CsgD family transcriptional regulator
MRPKVLRQAVTCLDGSDDRSVLARGLVDLAAAYHTFGEVRRERLIGRRAWTVASQCRADPLIRMVADDSGQVAGAVGDRVIELSAAEQRVAALVALGHTNREIGRQLVITVSTVEQHLTRIYRKLGAAGRVELAALLSVPEPAWEAS